MTIPEAIAALRVHCRVCPDTRVFPVLDSRDLRLLGYACGAVGATRFAYWPLHSSRIISARLGADGLPEEVPE